MNFTNPRKAQEDGKAPGPSICEMLPNLVISNNVMKFLTLGELLVSTKVSKRFKQMMNYHLIVDAATSTPCHANTTVNILASMAHLGSIHCPSPMRLLRLCNGIRCVATLDYMSPPIHTHNCSPSCSIDAKCATET